jgi:hypothetical protein
MACMGIGQAHLLFFFLEQIPELPPHPAKEMQLEVENNWRPPQTLSRDSDSLVPHCRSRDWLWVRWLRVLVKLVPRTMSLGFNCSLLVWSVRRVKRTLHGFASHYARQKMPKPRGSADFQVTNRRVNPPREHRAMKFESLSPLTLVGDQFQTSPYRANA